MHVNLTTGVLHRWATSASRRWVLRGTATVGSGRPVVIGAHCVAATTFVSQLDRPCPAGRARSSMVSLIARQARLSTRLKPMSALHRDRWQRQDRQFVVVFVAGCGRLRAS